MSSTLDKVDFSRLGPAAGARVVVTGGCGGIGMAVVEACHAQGLQVAVLDLAESIAARTLPSDVLTFAIDVHREETVTSAFAALMERWGGADALVNLIGYTTDLMRIEDMSMEAFDELTSGNLRGMVLCCREGVKLLKAAGAGSIVNASTGLANIGNPGYGAYAASKAGINALTRMLASEVAPEIRVNAVAPGGVDTAFIRGGFGRGGSEEGPPARIDLERYKTMVPLRRIGVPEDIVGPILFLLSDAARYMTGQVLHVNGGGLMRD